MIELTTSNGRICVTEKRPEPPTVRPGLPRVPARPDHAPTILACVGCPVCVRVAAVGTHSAETAGPAHYASLPVYSGKLGDGVWYGPARMCGDHAGAVHAARMRARLWGL